MEMFNKLKAKLAEELDSETESNAEYAGGERGAAGGAQGSPADQVGALEAEVREVKEQERQFLTRETGTCVGCLTHSHPSRKEITEDARAKLAKWAASGQVLPSLPTPFG